MTAVVDHRGTQAEFDRKELATDLSETLLKANIPLEKLDHPAIRDFIERRVPRAGSIPSAKNVREWYLPKIQKSHTEELNLIMDEADLGSNGAQVLTINANKRVTYLRSRMGSDRLYQEASSNNCLLISTRSSHCSQITESQYRFNHDLSKELHPQ